MRAEINKTLAKLQMLVEESEENTEHIEIVEQVLQDKDEARIIIQQAVQIKQRNLEDYLSDIVTKALDIVFLDEAKEFVVEFVPRRGNTECDLWFRSGNNLIAPLDNSGFGEADVASFALRAAYWSLGNTRNTLVVDEPFKYLDGTRLDRAIEMVKALSDELGLQMILVTHESEMDKLFDKRFHVVMKNKVSTVVELESHESWKHKIT